MNKRLLKIGLAVLFLSSLLGFICFRAASGPVSKDELQRFLSDEKNGLVVCDSLEHVTYKGVYMPAALVQERMLRGHQTDSQVVLHHPLYFVLKCSFYNNDLFSHANVPYDYRAALGNISFNLRNYIYAVIDKKDTIPLVSSVYARNYGTTGSSDVLLLFDAKKEYRQCDILVYDFIFETGQRIKLRYQYDDISKCPTLKQQKNT